MVFISNQNLTFFFHDCYLCCWHLLYIAPYDQWECQVTATCLFWLPVTSRLKGKAFLVNYYAKWYHRKIMTSSTEVNIFSFFCCTGRACQLSGVWTTTNLFCTWVQLHHSPLQIAPFFCKHLAYVFIAFPTTLLAPKENVNKSYLIISQLTSLSLKKDHKPDRNYGLGSPNSMLSTHIDQRGLLTPLQDLVSREDDISFLFQVLPLITPPPLKNIYACVEMLK